MKHKEYSKFKMEQRPVCSRNKRAQFKRSTPMSVFVKVLDVRLQQVAVSKEDGPGSTLMHS